MENKMNVNGVLVDATDVFNKYVEWGDKRQVEAYIVGLTDCSDKDASQALRTIIKNKGRATKSSSENRSVRPYRISSKDLEQCATLYPSLAIYINGAEFTPLEIYSEYSKHSGSEANKLKETCYYIAYKAKLDMTINENKVGVEALIRSVIGYASSHEFAFTRKETDSQEQYVPRCPVCGSPSIKKIGMGTRMLSQYAFGLAGSRALAQRECKNCGYKF